MASDGKETDMEEGADGKVTWSGMWYEFTQTTTFHGIHYITEKTPYVIRRILWVLIVAGVSSGFIAVIWDRAEKYMRREKNVNVDINYIHHVNFPAVTICNQNYVRMTKTYEQRTFNTISSYFSDNGRMIRDENERCRHRYIGKVGWMLNTNASSGVAVKTFADLTLDTCRRLCTDLPQVKCKVFSFNKISRLCTLTDVAGVRDWREIDGSIFHQYEVEDVVTLFKELCETARDDDTRIGDGMVIHPRVDKDLWEHNNNTDDFRVFLRESGHQKRDMIHSCSWLGHECSEDNFTTVMTDYGVCYSFNVYNPRQPTEGLETHKTGSMFGLKLSINVEEYEYMPGPHHDSGIKMFLHDRRELPMVRDLGFAVPPGRHSLIDVKYTELKNEVPPVGRCGEKELQYFSNYTWNRCWRDCETQIIVRECECKAPFMDSATKGEKTPICNMTHYFRCGMKAIESADAADDSCQCVEPCDRVLYDPALSNAALSSLSIESILAKKKEILQAKYKRAVNIMHRVKEHRFLAWAENLIHVSQAFKNFLTKVEDKSQRVDKDLKAPLLTCLTAFINIFKHDMNKGQFEGLQRALRSLALIYGPSRDTSYYLIERVIRNSKLVSLHAQNLVLYNFFYSKLLTLTNETIEFAAIANQTLPRYYQMVQDVPGTMEKFGYDYNALIFPPEKLAKTSDVCQEDIQKFFSELNKVHSILSQLYVHVSDYDTNKDEASRDAVQDILSDMYEGIAELSKLYEHTKTACLEQFQAAIGNVVVFNQTFLSEADTHSNLDYTFDFATESAAVRKDEEIFNQIKDNYLTHGSITKQELQHNLSENLFNEMISRQRELVVKVKFRLTERIRRRMDKARASGYDWYHLLIDNAEAIQEYMPFRFSEIRTRNLDIWKAPVAMVNIGNVSSGAPAFYYTYSVNTSSWRRSDFHREKALNTLREIINAYFVPINRAIDEFEEELSQLEAEFTTRIKALRNMVAARRTEEQLTHGFVKANFLQVDVYFSELRLQVITQFEAFTIGDLMGDVGGYMGLLLGASVVTVFELLDVLIYGFVLKLTQPFYRERKKNKMNGKPAWDSQTALDNDTVHSRSNLNANAYQTEFLPSVRSLEKSNQGFDYSNASNISKTIDLIGDMSKYHPYE